MRHSPWGPPRLRVAARAKKTLLHIGKCWLMLVDGHSGRLDQHVKTRAADAQADCA